MLLLILAGCSQPSTRERQTAPIASANEKTTQPDQSAKEQPAPESEEPPLPELKAVGRKVSLAWQEEGKTRLKASAREMTGNTVMGKASLKEVNAELYDNGKLVARLSAPSVQADEKTRVITATGGVTITSEVPGSTIKTLKSDWVKWYSREDKLIGDGGVTAVGPLANIQAAAFTANTRLGSVRLMSDSTETRAVIGR